MSDVFGLQRNEQGLGGEEATGGPEGKSPLENEGSQGGGRRILKEHA